VVLLEARRLAWGASGRNGGMVGSGYSIGHRGLVNLVGEGPARELNDLTRAALGLIRARIERYAIDCEPTAGGHVHCSWFDDGGALKAEVEWLARVFGETQEFWPREKVRELYRTKRYHDALFGAEGFQFHTLNFSLGIARAAEANGAILYEASPVTGFDLGAEPKVVNTPRGRVRADHVVFCLSGYIDGLHPKLARATLPVATYVMLTEPIPKERLESAIRAPYAVSDTRFASDYYRPLPDGRILWGGRVSSAAAPRRLLRRMLGDLVKVYPQLEGIEGEVAWPGTMGYARHKMPQIGELEPGVWYCQGFGGNGMCPTTVGGEAIAAAIAGEDERISLFEPFGLDYAGGRLGPLAAEALYAWWRLRDRLRAGIS
jgi:gamma-glutamylputrescine oxidase